MNTSARHCARCEELEEEVAFLKGELGLRDQDELLDCIHLKAGVTRSEVMFLLRLYRAKGHLVTKAQLEESVPPTWAEEDRVAHFVAVYTHRLRRALGYDAIANVWGRGYRLTEAGMAAVAAIINPEAQPSPSGGEGRA